MVVRNIAFAMAPKGAEFVAAVGTGPRPGSDILARFGADPDREVSRSDTTG
jgi:hypothetical protein